MDVPAANDLEFVDATAFQPARVPIQIMDVNFKKPGYYDLIDQIIAPTRVPFFHAEKHQHHLIFALSNDQCHLLLNPCAQMRVLVRTCIFEKPEEGDKLPNGLKLSVNGKFLFGNTEAPTNLEPRQPQFLDITSSLIMSPHFKQHVVFQGRFVCNLVVTIQMVKKQTLIQMIDSLPMLQEHQTEILIRDHFLNARDGAPLQVSIKFFNRLSRTVLPSRSIKCSHVQFFDGLEFLRKNEFNLHLECPVCYKKMFWEDLCIDKYFQMKMYMEDLSPQCDVIQYDPRRNAWMQLLPIVKHPYADDANADIGAQVLHCSILDNILRNEINMLHIIGGRIQQGWFQDPHRARAMFASQPGPQNSSHNHLTSSPMMGPSHSN